MSWDVYLSFGTGYSPPIPANNPTTKWDKYTCGKTLYWRVTNFTRSINSPIQTATVSCVTPSPTPTAGPIPNRTIGQIGQTYNKKVLLVVYNPQLSAAFGNKTVIDYYGFNDPYTLTDNMISWWESITNNRVNFTVAQQMQLNEFPKKADGFVYDEQTYNAVMMGTSASHNPDTADYNLILNETHACDLFNSGQIDIIMVVGRTVVRFL